jgi:HPt (histidine-containing phosphotransfer) domain-containing protein
MNQRFQQVSQTYRTRAIVGVIGICVISVSAVIATYFFGRSIIVYALGFATLVLLFFWTRVNFRRAKHYKKLNVNRLKESSDNDVAILEELYKAFEQNIKERVPLLELALKNEDQKNAVLYSHDFKGASAAIGLEDARQTALQLEMLSRAGDFKSAKKYFAKLCQELKEGSELLREYLEIEKATQQQQNVLFRAEAPIETHAKMSSLGTSKNGIKTE